MWAGPKVLGAPSLEAGPKMPFYCFKVENLPYAPMLVGSD